MPRALPAGISRRGKQLQITYAITAELAARYGCKKVQRESARTGDVKAAKSLRAQRKREVADGSWRPAKMSGAGLTVQAFFSRWTAERKQAGLKAAKRDAEELAGPLAMLGPMRLGDVRRVHIREAMAAEKAKPKRFGGARAPTTVIKTYAKLRAMFAEALRAELVLTNPCTLRTDGVDLPKNRDASPRWRKSAVFTRAELEQLISDDRIPLLRRMLYAMLGLTGMRLGEATARTWADYDPEAEPLGRLLVETQLDEDDDEEDEWLKTGVQREVPVHPVLAKMLAEWRLHGYAHHFERSPRPGDLMLLNTKGEPLVACTVWKNLQADLLKLDMRKRRVHDLRRTFISLARADGATELLRWVTHGGPSGEVFDDYTTPPFHALCEQVAKLRISPRGAAVRHIRSAQRGAQSAENTPFPAQK
jgi:integrase